LDRQNIFCPAGEALSSFVVTREGCGEGNMRYKYQCGTLVGMTADFAADTASDEQTGCNDMDGKLLEYLDRHNLQCPAGKVMSSFRVVRDGCQGTDMRYAFVCTGVPPPPTPAPTPAPEEEEAEIYGDPHVINYHKNQQTAALLQSGAGAIIQSTSVRETETSCTDMVGKELEFLDRQDVACGGDEALASFTVVGAGCTGNQKRYKMTCAEVPLQPSREEMSGCTDMEGKNLEYLDRQNVMCPPGEAMTSFTVTREGCGEGDMRYKLECAPLVGSTFAFHAATASNELTGCARMDGQKLEYLDRQNLQCPDGKVLNSFRVVRDGCGGEDMRYSFVCIAVPPPPTPAPTPAPTPTQEEQTSEIFGDPHEVSYHGSN
jgi:hypothetical protein